jgi:hypothetical protein
MPSALVGIRVVRNKIVMQKREFRELSEVQGCEALGQFIAIEAN